MLSGPIRIRVYRDIPNLSRRNLCGYSAYVFDAWEVFIYDDKVSFIDLMKAEKVEVTEKNKLRGSIQATFHYSQTQKKGAVFILKCILDDTNNIKIEITAYWNCSHRMAKLVIPLNISTRKAIYGAPYGKVERLDFTYPNATPEIKAKYEVPSTGWVAILDKEVSVGIATHSRFGFSKKDKELEISLLRGPTFPTKQGLDLVSILPKWALTPQFLSTGFAKFITKLLARLNTLIRPRYMDQGKHTFLVAIRSLPNNDILDVIKMWMEILFRPIIIPLNAPEAEQSLIKITPPDVLSYIKPSEEGNGLTIRLWNPRDIDVEVNISPCGISISKAYICDALERKISELKVNEGTVTINVPKNSLLTIMFIIKK